jgi:hypothetical protein
MTSLRTTFLDPQDATSWFIWKEHRSLSHATFGEKYELEQVSSHPSLKKFEGNFCHHDVPRYAEVSNGIRDDP